MRGMDETESLNQLASLDWNKSDVLRTARTIVDAYLVGRGAVTTAARQRLVIGLRDCTPVTPLRNQLLDELASV